ncbi:hypothetical protein ACFOYU_17185 [Microvirga sp. GCM10011540]|uniref:hypothetical protein n=1 Tax=Microvirga sp. GCM10011540 TaxID=3317338 RepID=UPI0036232C39
MGWFNKQSEAADSSSKSLDHVEEFLGKYDRSGAGRTGYAMTLWGIHAAFVKIFGSLDDYYVADSSKKNHYITMIGNNAIRALEAGETRVAECNHAFMNFLVATKDVPRRELRGSIEAFADRIDAIVNFGKSEIDRVGEMEKEAKEFLASDAPFAIGTGTVRGAVTERNVVAASQIIINDLQKILVTHQDYHLYIIEQYARLRLESGIRTMLDNVPLFEVEFEVLGLGWSQNSPRGPGVAYIETIRPAIRAWCEATVPSLDPGELSLRVIGAAYGHFRITGKSHFDEIRRGYAQHFHDQCLQQGRHVDAARWADVVERLGQ